jgi:hypothetical protein
MNVVKIKVSKMWLPFNGLTLDASRYHLMDLLWTRRNQRGQMIEKIAQFVWKKWPKHFLHPKRQNICIKAQFEHIKDLQKKFETLKIPSTNEVLKLIHLS